MSGQRLSSGLFALAAVGSVALGAVPPWRGTGALVVGLLVLLRPPGRWSAVLVALTAAPLVWPASSPEHGLSALAPLVLLVGAALLREAPDRPLRLGLAATAGAVGVLLAVKQVVAASVLPAAVAVAPGLIGMGLVAAALVLAAPGGRAGGLALVLAGGLAAGRGLHLGATLEALPLPVAAERVSSLRAHGLWDALEERGMAALDHGDVDGALAVVRAVPRRTRVGEALVRQHGPERPLAVGWDPTGPLAPDVAIATAEALRRQGEGARAVRLLKRRIDDPQVAFALALHAAEQGDEALVRRAMARAELPEALPTAPGPVLPRRDLLVGGIVEVAFLLEGASSRVVVEARGEGWQGLPHLAVVLSGHRVGTFEVPEEGMRQVVELALPPGPHRLEVAYTDDVSGEGGDRNLRDVAVWVE